MADYPKHSICMERDGLENHCTWKPNTTEECPHVRESRKEDHARKIKNSMIECIGNTPMVRVGNIMESEGIEC